MQPENAEIMRKLDDLERQLVRLARAIEGEQPFSLGLARRVTNVEDTIKSELEKARIVHRELEDLSDANTRRIDRIIAWAAGAGATAGLLGGLIAALVSWLLGG